MYQLDSQRSEWNAYLHRIDVVDSDMGSDACFDRPIVIFVETAAGSVSHAERLERLGEVPVTASSRLAATVGVGSEIRNMHL